MKGSNHRVLFQNAEGNINMGVFFNDPDVDLDDIFWYNQLAGAIFDSLKRKEGLISVDEELDTRSCYVELHRIGKSELRRTVRNQYVIRRNVRKQSAR